MSRETHSTPRSTKSGIQTAEDGGAYIPSSKRADGTTRKEIKVRPGYRPPEDVETYKNRSAEVWKSRGQGGIPGAEPVAAVNEDSLTKSKNAKRREAAKRKVAEGSLEAAEDGLASAMAKAEISNPDERTKAWHDPSQLTTNDQATAGGEAEQQKKIRNQLKKVRAVHDLKQKKAAGERLSPDQVMKIGKEGELLRDLKKMGYDGPELHAEGPENPDAPNQSAAAAG